MSQPSASTSARPYSSLQTLNGPSSPSKLQNGPFSRGGGSGLFGRGRDEQDTRLEVSPGLYRLIGDNAPMLVLGKERQRSEKAKGKRAQRWEWTSFDNPARKDGLRLSHWEPASRAAEEVPYPFAAYNASTNIYSYSSDEYLSYCRDDTGDWSKEETDYLFHLCHTYDLRWFVIKDRWEWPPLHLREQEQPQADRTAVTEKDPSAASEKGNFIADANATEDRATLDTQEEKAADGDTEMTAVDGKADAGSHDTAPALLPDQQKVQEVQASPVPAAPTSTAASKQPNTYPQRTMEEIKDRYFSICRRLIRNRPASDENAKNSYLHSYAYDKDRESLRKKHVLEHIMNHTPEQLAEEEFLYVESRRLEQTYARTSREREELWRLLGGIGPQSSSALAQNSSFLSQQAQANAAAAAGINNKKRRRGELDMLEQTSGGAEKTAAAAPQLTSAQDEQYCITRYPEAGGGASSAPAQSVMRPAGVFLRSTKPPALKTSLAPKIQAFLTEQNISMRLVMPTRQNMERLEGLVSAITSLLDCRKQVERAEHEVKILRTRKDAAMRIEEEDRLQAKFEAEQKEREASGQSGSVPPQVNAASMQADK